MLDLGIGKSKHKHCLTAVILSVRRAGKFLFALFVFFYACAYTYAQEKLPLTDQATDKMLFNHLTIGIGLGTEGASIELGVPAGEYVGLRAGMSYMPSWQISKSIDMSQQAGGTSMKMDSVMGILHDVTGLQFSNEMTMLASTQIWHGKILVDVYPFKKKNWFFTAGLYFGPKNVMHIENAAQDMGMLIALSTFNHLYDKSEEAMATGNPAQLFGDIALTPQMMEQILSMGKLGVEVGTFKTTTEAHQAGDTYLMVSDENGMIRLDVEANVVRPYVGFGYQTAISKDKRSFFSIDAGILCWGTPKVLTHDGINIVKDLDVTNQTIKRYTDLANHMKVYPAINIRFSRRIL